MIEFDYTVCSDLAEARSREWLITNGLGGYASSTICSLNTRRYHGLLVAATKPPLGRAVLLSHLEDALIVDGVRFELSTNLYAGGFVHPAGYLNLVRFQLEPFPTFTYAHEGWELEKSIFMVHGENTTVIEYTLTQCPPGSNITLEVRPLIAFRDAHQTTHRNDQIDRRINETPGVAKLHPYPDLPALYLAHDEAKVQIDGIWYTNFEYEEERARGLDFLEDLFSPLIFETDIHKTGRFCLTASTEPLSTPSAADLRLAELKRLEATAPPSTAHPAHTSLLQTLHRAADQFVVDCAPHKALLAGYHWFGEWGRDTMIALPGLLFETGRPELAREILLQYAGYVSGGMLPNRFPDAGDEPEYNTVDATLWYFEAVRQYIAYRADEAWQADARALLRDSLYAPLQSIVSGHLAGTRYGIHIDGNGFLWAGDDTTQLTWMDAKVGDTAFTPRSGRAVEIQALWHNALRTLAHFAYLLQDAPAAASYTELADKLQANFENVFWKEDLGFLNDVVGEHEYDASLRPNQMIAISLHYPLLTGDRARRAVDAVERELLTPFGLRTLSPKDSRYRGRYEGGVWDRDSAYHQGTVWPWLAGPFFFAKLRAHDNANEVVSQLEAWLEAFSIHLREAGLAQVSEILDGDAPHTPRGCIAQAWSVSELLRLAKRVEASWIDTPS